MTDISKRLRASVGFDAINGDSFERDICGKQMLEAADTIDRLGQDLEEANAYIISLERALDLDVETKEKKA